MQLKPKRERLERWSHFLHVMTLIVFAFALLPSFVPPTEMVARGIEGYLKWFHIGALALLVADGTVFALFARNAGRETGEALEKSFTPLPAAPTPAPGARTFSWQPMPLGAGTWEFVTAKTGPASTMLLEMSREGIEGTRAELEPEELQERNKALIAKNPKVFMLVRDPYPAAGAAAEWIGFTCVLPLNAAGEDLYLNGKMSDSDLRASLVSAPGEASEAALLFGLELVKKVRGGPRAPFLYTELLRYAGEHAKQVAAQSPAKGARARLWVEASHETLEKQLAGLGFEKTEKRSGDEFPLYARPI